MRPHGARPPGDGDNSPHDDSPQSNDPFTDLVIPDDARELDADLRAWQREERWRRRRDRASSVLPRRLRGRRLGVGVPIALLVLLAVSLLVSFAAGFNALLGANPPPHTARPQALPLADPQVPAGQPGGLLPAVDVTASGRTISARDLRPAVVLLAPPGCDCDAQVHSLVGQAQAYRLSVYLIGPPAQHSSLANLAAGPGQAVPVVVDDPSGTFATTYEPQELTAVLVAADGVIERVVTGIDADTHLEAQLRPLVAAGATPTVAAKSAPLR